jgi:hypothetical protein
MKIRSGFISNSSSSSFIIIAPGDIINTATKSMSKFGQAVVDDVIGELEEITLDGKTYTLAHSHYSTEEFADRACSEFQDKECEEALNEWKKFQTAVTKLGGIVREIGC